MIKRLIPLAALYGVVLLIAACVKKDSAPNSSQEQTLIEEAKEHFIYDVSITEGMGAATTGSKHHYLQKTPRWEFASVERLNSVNTVVVPIAFYDTTHSVKMIGKDAKLPLSNIAFMLVYHNPKKGNELTTELMYIIPDKSSTPKKFSGTTIIEQWDGTILRGYQHLGDAVSRLSVENSPNVTYARGTVCETIDWYTCTHVGNYPEYCQYNYSSTRCIELPDGGSSGSNSGDPGGGMPSGTGSGRVDANGNPVYTPPSTGGGPSRAGIEPYGMLQICSKSFKFSKVIELDASGKGGWQIAAVMGMHMNLIDSRTPGIPKAVSPGPVVYFGFPVVRKDGTFYSKETAAQMAVDIDKLALGDLMRIYELNRANLDWEGMNVEYRKALNKYAEQKGGKVTLTPGLGNSIGDITPSIAKYSGILGWNCD